MQILDNRTGKEDINATNGWRGPVDGGAMRPVGWLLVTAAAKVKLQKLELEAVCRSGEIAKEQ